VAQTNKMILSFLLINWIQTTSRRLVNPHTTQTRLVKLISGELGGEELAYYEREASLSFRLPVAAASPSLFFLNEDFFLFFCFLL
jgi:hypothetical protein